MKRDATIAPGQSMETLRSFVAVHRGDYFDTLRAYSAAMQAQGIRLPDAPKDAFDPIWCAWGYGRDVHARAGLRDAAGRETARLRLGGARRRLAGRTRRLAAAPATSSRPAMPT